MIQKYTMSSAAGDTHIWIAGEPVPPVLGAECVIDAAVVAGLLLPRNITMIR